MKILVTGATGFVGKALCSALKKECHEVVEISSKHADLTNPKSLEAFSSFSFDQIYHLAAWTQAGDFCLRHPGEQWLINQKINTHILDWWAQHQPQAKMIALGTSCAYDPHLAHTEANYFQGEPIDSLFSYAMTKRMLLAGLIALQKQYNLEYLYLIPSTLYGPDYHEDVRQMHFIFDLIRKILRGSLYDEPVILWGDGEQKRELIHREDFIAAMLQLVSIEKNRWINLGSGEETSIREYAQLICELVGYPHEKICYDTQRYVGAKSKFLRVETLKQLIPNFTPRKLEDGLKEVIEWFRSKEATFLSV